MATEFEDQEPIHISVRTAVTDSGDMVIELIRPDELSALIDEEPLIRLRPEEALAVSTEMLYRARDMMAVESTLIVLSESLGLPLAELTQAFVTRVSERGGF